MKAYTIFFVSICILFCSVFAAAQSIRFRPWTKPGQEEAFEAAVSALETSELETDSAPKIDVSETVFDFGSARIGTVANHEFKIRNQGDGPLVIRDGGTSCGCLTNNFGVKEIRPGGSFDVKLSWETFEHDLNFAKVQKILTNDSATPELMLTIKGKSFQLIESDRPAITAEVAPASNSWHQETITFTSSVLQQLQVDHVELLDLPGEVTFQQESSDPSGNASGLLLARFNVQSPGIHRGVIRTQFRIPEEYAENGTPQQTIDIPVSIKTIRRLSLYSPHICRPQGAELLSSNSQVKLELGKIRFKNRANVSWSVVAKLRGAERPTNIDVQLTGIDGLEAHVDYDATKPIDSIDSFVVRLTGSAQMRPGVYDRENSGTLILRTPGLTGEEMLELPVTLDVLN